MVLGAIWCPLEKSAEIAARIREIKQRHQMPPAFEIKWTKVSPGKLAFYMDLLDYFFDDDDLHLRALVVPDKSKLAHPVWKQTHDDWYYKMYFDMLKVILDPNARYRIYIDIKDTRTSAKAERLHQVLCNNIYDFSHWIVERVQVVRSEEVAILQMVDLLIGAVSYANRGLSSSTAKQALVQRMRRRSGHDLTGTTLYREDKVNLLRWHASEVIA